MYDFVVVARFSVGCPAPETAIRSFFRNSPILYQAYHAFELPPFMVDFLFIHCHDNFSSGRLSEQMSLPFDAAAYRNNSAFGSVEIQTTATQFLTDSFTVFSKGGLTA